MKNNAVAGTEIKKNRNRFNRLTSKEWLPFQKSWFRFDGKEKLYRENFRFFTPAGDPQSTIYYHGKDLELAQVIAEKENLQLTQSPETPLQFALIDLLDEVNDSTTLESYEEIKARLIPVLEQIFKHLAERRFIAVLIPNIQKGAAYYPFAWDLAPAINGIFSLKDEKIACMETAPVAAGLDFFQPQKKTFYCLYFRKDEFATGKQSPKENRFFSNNVQNGPREFANEIPSWYILKPQPRKKNEILHPAKYPEDLPEMYIREFTNAGDNIFDPMSGTGSTQLAALKLGRNGYGTELSGFFSEIANDRCQHYLQDKAASLQCRIFNSDARLVRELDMPSQDYMITSPPYWDMLNMKGAENQAKRIEKGLQTNYSDNSEDLGNIAAYHDFLMELVQIYLDVIKKMKPGSYLTIVVKNIKKKGRNYPFAWDLANELQRELMLLPETFWCQDDISIAPFGYGNTWVSNTFHQYCLTFQKPF